MGHLLLQEYKRLKQEQLARIGTRDNLIYVTLGSLAAVVAATLQLNLRGLLLSLPPICLVLGWTYLANDEKVSAIGQHIRTVLTPQIQAALNTDTPIFTWEQRHRADPGRRFQRTGQLLVDLMTFCLPAVVGIAAYWSAGDRSVRLMALSVIELTGVLVLAWAIINAADFGRALPMAELPAQPTVGQRDPAR